MTIVLKIFRILPIRGVCFGLEEDAMYVCLCKAVVERRIRDLIAQGAREVRDIQRACAAGSDCGACIATIKQMVHESKNVQEQSLPSSQPEKLMK